MDFLSFILDFPDDVSQNLHVSIPVYVKNFLMFFLSFATIFVWYEWKIHWLFYCHMINFTQNEADFMERLINRLRNLYLIRMRT